MFEIKSVSHERCNKCQCQLNDDLNVLRFSINPLLVLPSAFMIQINSDTTIPLQLRTLLNYPVK